MREPLPLATIHRKILEFVVGRTDCALFGAQAVNAYTTEPRMTQDVDLLSTAAAQLAEELRSHLSKELAIAVRVRIIKEGAGYRLYQVRKPTNRHLADVRAVQALPPVRVVEGIQVIEVPELIAQKVISLHARRNAAKGGTDLADLRRLLLAFPHLKQSQGLVRERLDLVHASPPVVSTWEELVAQDIAAEGEEDDF